MSENENEIDAAWLGGIMDGFGEINIKKNTMYVKFKSVYPDRLKAIADALGINRAPKGPFDPSGDSKKPYYHLVLVGSDLARLENVATRYMRTTRHYLFGETRLRLQRMRKRMKLSGPSYKIASADEL